MIDLIAVDPGDVHVGVAFFREVPDAKWGWECYDALEFEPDEFMDALTETLLANELKTLVFERFRLYEDKSLEQKGSEFETAQLIGQMKFMVRKHNEHVKLHVDAEAKGKMLTCELQGRGCADAAIDQQPVTMVGQFADVMKPTRGIAKKRGITSTARAIDRKEYEGRGHVIAAELHGWYWVLEGSVTGKQSNIYYHPELVLAQ